MMVTGRMICNPVWEIGKTAKEILIKASSSKENSTDKAFTPMLLVMYIMANFKMV